MTKPESHGMHTVQLTIAAIPVRDTAHPFVRRLRGEVGASFCMACGERRSAGCHIRPAKRTHPNAILVAMPKNCLDCGVPVSPKAQRCFPCSNRRISVGASKRTAIYVASRDADRREVPK